MIGVLQMLTGQQLNDFALEDQINTVSPSNTTTSISEQQLNDIVAEVQTNMTPSNAPVLTSESNQSGLTVSNGPDTISFSRDYDYYRNDTRTAENSDYSRSIRIADSSESPFSYGTYKISDYDLIASFNNLYEKCHSYLVENVFKDKPFNFVGISNSEKYKDILLLAVEEPDDDTLIRYLPVKMDSSYNKIVDATGAIRNINLLHELETTDAYSEMPVSSAPDTDPPY